jgi:hypothetical protein
VARMTDQEILTVLAKASAFDGRHPDAAMAAAWLEAIGDLPFEDTLQAVVDHYATSTDWVKPGHLRALVKKARAERLRGVDQLLPPVHPDAKDYSKQVRRFLAEVADGRTVAKALAGSVPRQGTPPTAEYVAARGPGYLRRRLALGVPCPLESCEMVPGRPCRIVGGGRREVPTGYHPARLDAAKDAMEASG